LLARSAGNEVLVNLVEQLTALTRFVREAVVRSTQTRRSFVLRLKEVVDAVADGDWQRATQRMRLHLLEGPAALGLVTEERLDLETKTWLTEQ
jgi:DNA-binding GntR family transcriptional regulator